MLLKILRDITHKHDVTKNERMAIVESNIELYLSQLGKNDTIDEHYQLLKPRVDTITAHGDMRGHHPAYPRWILDQEWKKDRSDIQTSKAMEPVAKEAYGEKVLAMAWEEYLGYLFIKQADYQQYGEIKYCS